MRTYKVKAFGITKDILGANELSIVLNGDTVAELRTQLQLSYPRLAALNSLMVAVNRVYAEDALQLNEADEIALIPPVSGG